MSMSQEQETSSEWSVSDVGDESYADTTVGHDADKAKKKMEEAKPPTSGPRAEKQHEDVLADDEGEADYGMLALRENASKMAEKVWTAIPRRYRRDSLPTIYVVPRDLAEGSKDPYEPEVVCIGPLFDQRERRKKPRCKLERYKWCCLRKLVVDAADAHENLLGKCLDTMRELEPKIRTAYGDTISVGGDTLALMMLLDGSFLLHRLMVQYARKNSEENVEDDDWTQVVGRCGIWDIVTRDLLLLKNQLPFFVLQKLFELLRSCDSDDDKVLIKGGLRLFAPLRPGPAAGSSSTITSCDDIHHLLHLFYKSAISPTESMPRQKSDQNANDAPWVQCAKELEDAGVSFQAKKHNELFFHNVSFRRGICGGRVLQIPPLELYDYSEALFRNLVAFEQTYLFTPGIVTAYALFMDSLIKTPQDMRLLHHSGVLVSHMNGDRDAGATGFFSRVCAQAHINWDRSYLDGVMRDVVMYQKRTLPRWRAALIRNYFSNPWVATTLAFAVIAFILTFLQTFYTVYPYYKPGK